MSKTIPLLKPGDKIEYTTAGGKTFKGTVVDNHSGAGYTVKRTDGKTVTIRRDYEYYPPPDRPDEVDEWLTNTY